MAVSAYLDTAAMSAGLKELYTDEVIQRLVYSDNPFLALVPKDTGFVGKLKPIPIIIGTGQGRSATFASAKANQTADDVRAFQLTRKKDYSIGTIDNELMEASAKDKGAFLKGAKLKIDGAFDVITNSTASGAFRSGTGSIGQVSAAGLSTGVITLADPESVTQFELNQTLRCSNGTTDGNAVRAAKGYVIAVDRAAGKITVSAVGLGGAAGDPSGWAASEFLSIDGDLNAKPSGLAAWLPKTAPGSSDSFYGVNRSADPTRLAGVRWDGSGQSIEEALIDASMLVSREGGKPETCITNFLSYGALEKSLGSKVQYVDLQGPAGIGFKGIRINGHKGPINVIPDRSCQGATAYLLQMNTWCLESLNDAPHIVTYGDGAEMMRVADADAAEVRIASYHNFSCNAPGYNAVVSLSV